MTFNNTTKNKNCCGRSLIVDALLTFIMSLGIMFLIKPIFSFDVSNYILILYSVASTLLITFFTRKKLLLLTGIGTALFAGLISVFIFSSYSRILGTLYGLIKWCIKLFPEESTYNTLFYKSAVVVTLIFFISAVVFLFIRKIPSILPLTIACVAVYIWIIIESYELNILGVVLCLIAIVSCIACNSYFKNSSGLLGFRKSFLFSGIALLCSICLVICSVAVAPKTVEKSETSERLSAKIQQMLGLYSFDQKHINENVLNKMGLQPNIERLGGNIYLANDTAVLSVQADYGSLMKAYVCTDYTGYSWEDSDESIYILNDSAAYNVQNQVFKPAIYNPDAQKLISDASVTEKTKVTSLLATNTLFSTGSNVTVTPMPALQLLLHFNTSSEMFSFEKLPINYSYDINSTKYIDNAENRLKLTEAEYKLIDTIDPLYENKEFVNSYTALPSNYSVRAKNIAQDLTKNSKGTLESLYAIYDYFKYSDLYTYTTFPGDVPEDREFVDYFIQTKKGYCVYFATAMCTMARSLGIPSRFVCGYGMEVNSDRNSWICKENFAHAWVECYVKGLGWITFDPTPTLQYTDHEKPLTLDTEHMPENNEPDNNNGDDSDEEDDSDSENKDPDEITSDPDADGVGVQEGGVTYIPNIDTDEDEQDQNKEFPWKAILLCIGTVLLIVLLIALRVIYSSKKYDVAIIRKRFSSTAQQAEYYYKDIMRQLKLLGYDLRTGESIIELASRVSSGADNIINEEERSIFEVFSAVLYGRFSPSNDDIERIAVLHNSIEKWVRRKYRLLMYIIRRRII